MKKPYRQFTLRTLALASLASSDGGQDTVDAAIRAAALRVPVSDSPVLVTFIPFDPAVKRAGATVRQTNGEILQVAKGAFNTIATLSQSDSSAAAIVDELQAKGFRVLAVASGPEG